MHHLTRRDFVTLASASLTAGLPVTCGSKPAPRRFRFVFVTDIHMQPELGAPEATALAVRKIRSLKPRPSFVVTGGDNIDDAQGATRDRAEMQFRLLREALAPLEMPVFYTLGNRDVYGWARGTAAEGDVDYGKRMFEERVARGPCHRSFLHGAWRFLILDSVSRIPPTGWRGDIDDTQLQWIKDELTRAGTDQPVAMVTHVPLMSLWAQYTSGATAASSEAMIVRNGKEVRELFRGHNVRLVLQGHTHTVEENNYAGTRYITGGALCGKWWRGSNLGIHPEGFVVADVNGQAVRWHYLTYGWQADKPTKRAL